MAAFGAMQPESVMAAEQLEELLLRFAAGEAQQVAATEASLQSALAKPAFICDLLVALQPGTFLLMNGLIAYSRVLTGCLQRSACAQLRRKASGMPVCVPAFADANMIF
eukprot:6173472-Pleurochrysis_carterae.AAC.1